MYWLISNYCKTCKSNTESAGFTKSLMKTRVILISNLDALVAARVCLAGCYRMRSRRSIRRPAADAVCSRLTFTSSADIDFKRHPTNGGGRFQMWRFVSRWAFLSWRGSDKSLNRPDHTNLKNTRCICSRNTYQPTHWCRKMDFQILCWELLGWNNSLDWNFADRRSGSRCLDHPRCQRIVGHKNIKIKYIKNSGPNGLDIRLLLELTPTNRLPSSTPCIHRSWYTPDECDKVGQNGIWKVVFGDDLNSKVWIRNFI